MNTISRLTSSLLLPLVLSAGATSALASVPASEAGAPRAPRLDGILRYDTQQIAVPAGIPESAEIKVEINGTVETLRLVRTSLRSDKAKLLLDRGNGKMEEAPLPPHRTYRGTVASNGALVSASIIDGRLTAMIDMPESTYFVQPMSDFGAARGSTAHVVHSHADVAPFDDHRCGYDEYKMPLPDWMLGEPSDPGEQIGGGGGAPFSGGEGGIAGTTPFVTEIAFDADFEFFQLNGSNANNVVNDIENVMNNVTLVYDRDVNITYEFSTFVVRTNAADPYTSTVMDTLLCEFRNTWNTTPESQIQRDVAQLFTGKQITGNVIGLAWLGVVCNQGGNACSATGSLAYSVVESRFTNSIDFRTSLSAHEIGHNWQSGHCDGASPCNIMCSVVNSCSGTTGSNLKFSPTAQSAITGYRNAVSCDPVLPASIALPFSDSFDGSAAINTNNWIYSKGAAVSTAAVNEPSPARSLNLDALGNLAYGDDEIRSNFMLLAGLPTVIVQYATQHIGVESGKQLVVEYLNNTLDWVVLNTITSDGVNQTNFDQWQHTLPANAKHNKFRLRFRTVVDAADDDWFIDDVRVVPVIVPDNDECETAIAIGEGTFSFNTTNATDSATSLPAFCDDGAGTTMAKDIWYLYNATCDGLVTVTTCGTANFDTRIAAYTLACPPAGGILACDDNDAGCPNQTSSMFFPAFAGQAVFLRIGGATGGGTGSFSVTCAPFVVCPADLNNDGGVDGSDLAILLNAWATPNADVDGDGTTNGADLAAVLNAWGACP
jgi:hypothetical protein